MLTEFFVRPSSHLGVYSLRKIGVTSTSERVRLARLDHLLLEIDRVDVDKIDVEGAECHVLEGMRMMLRRNKPSMILKMTPTFLSSMNRISLGIQEILLLLGYKGFEIEHGGLRHVPDLAKCTATQSNVLLQVPGRRSMTAASSAC